PFIRPPHDYGVAIILLGVANRLVPAGQVDAVRAATLQFLDASALDAVDKDASLREFAALRRTAESMPEPSSTLIKYLSNRDVVHLGARLLPLVGTYGESAALSAARSPKPS